MHRNQHHQRVSEAYHGSDPCSSNMSIVSNLRCARGHDSQRSSLERVFLLWPTAAPPPVYHDTTKSTQNREGNESKDHAQRCIDKTENRHSVAYKRCERNVLKQLWWGSRVLRFSRQYALHHPVAGISQANLEVHHRKRPLLCASSMSSKCGLASLPEACAYGSTDFG